jgi:hypothetical protein
MPFQPGQSGNPGGRPKGPALTDSLRSLLRRRGPDGRLQRDAIAARLVEKALAGDLDAIRYIFDRIDGPLTQRHDLASPGRDAILVRTITAEIPPEVSPAHGADLDGETPVDTPG